MQFNLNTESELPIFCLKDTQDLVDVNLFLYNAMIDSNYVFIVVHLKQIGIMHGQILQHGKLSKK